MMDTIRRLAAFAMITLSSVSPSQATTAPRDYPVSPIRPGNDNILEKDSDGNYVFEGVIGKPPIGQVPTTIRITITYDPPSQYNPEVVTLPVSVVTNPDGSNSIKYNGPKQGIYGDGRATITYQPLRPGKNLGEPTITEGVTVRNLTPTDPNNP